MGYPDLFEPLQQGGCDTRIDGFLDLYWDARAERMWLEIEDWNKAFEKIGFIDAPINTALGPIRNDKIRNNTRVMIEDNPRPLETVIVE